MRSEFEELRCANTVFLCALLALVGRLSSRRQTTWLMGMLDEVSPELITGSHYTKSPQANPMYGVRDSIRVSKVNRTRRLQPIGLWWIILDYFAAGFIVARYLSDVVGMFYPYNVNGFVSEFAGLNAGTPITLCLSSAADTSCKSGRSISNRILCDTEVGKLCPGDLIRTGLVCYFLYIKRWDRNRMR